MLGNFQGLLPIVRLRYQQIFSIDPQFFSIVFIEGMFGINKCSQSSSLLSLCNAMHRQSGFTGGLWSINFDDSTSWNSTNTQGHIQSQRPCRNGRYILDFIVTKLHYGTFTVSFFQLVDGQLQSFEFFCVITHEKIIK